MPLRKEGASEKCMFKTLCNNTLTPLQQYTYLSAIILKPQ